MCRRVSWLPNMLTLPLLLSSVTRPEWSMPFSIIWRGVCARPDRTMAAPDDISAEDRLIARFFRPIATDLGALGLSDDAAFIKPPPGCDLVLKTDAIIGGVHFFPDDPADTVAQKALRVNISDLAAKGATPLGCLLSLGMPVGVSESWLAAFSDGLGADTARFNCPLFGGDTVRT